MALILTHFSRQFRGLLFSESTPGLCEVKNRYHGLEDMLRIVMNEELRIIGTEESFLSNEPHKLHQLVGR